MAITPFYPDRQRHTGVGLRGPRGGPSRLNPDPRPRRTAARVRPSAAGLSAPAPAGASGSNQYRRLHLARAPAREARALPRGVCEAAVGTHRSCLRGEAVTCWFPQRCRASSHQLVQDLQPETSSHAGGLHQPEGVHLPSDLAARQAARWRPSRRRRRPGGWSRRETEDSEVLQPVHGLGLPPRKLVPLIGQHSRRVQFPVDG